MPDFSIGVDLGGTNLRIAAVSQEGELLEKINLSTKVELGRDQVIAEMCGAIRQLAEKYKAAGRFLGAGIGVPGIIDRECGTIRKAANLPGWENYPVGAEIERRLCASGLLENEARIVLENDARVAAFGEQWLGAARGVPNMAIITLGTGMGGGIVMGGKIWHGMNGMAGEFGHVTLEPEGIACGCGNRGCAEKYASASALLRMAREAIAGGDAPALAKASSMADFGAQSIYNLAIEGDVPSSEIFRTFGRYLGIMLADIVNVLNLEMHVLGGGAAGAWDAFAPTMFDELRQRSIVYAATVPDDPEVLPGRPRSSVQRSSVPAEKSPAGAGARPNSRSAANDEGARRTIITRALLGSDAGLYGAARVAVLAG
jgi:glucokinase